MKNRLISMELFCGTKSFSKVFKEKGYITYTTDIDVKFKPDLVRDILDLDIFDFPPELNVLWASPPCDTFSVASIGKYWNKDHTPKDDRAKKGLEILNKTINLIADELNNNPNLIWFIENPRGKMRKVIDKLFLFNGISDYERKTITYCQYGDDRMKPTDIWTNLKNWETLPICKNGDPCHTSAPRGSRTGTQGIKGKELRGVIPPSLFEEIIEVIKQNDK